MVYTPALLDEGIYIANLTVPEGLFWSDIINPPGAPISCTRHSQVLPVQMWGSSEGYGSQYFCLANYHEAVYPLSHHTAAF